MDDLDRMLSSDEHVSPSIGFTKAVMDAVDAAASEPPPFPFPWHLYGVGVLGCNMWAASCVWLFDIVAESADGVMTTLVAVRMPLEYAAVAACVCLATVAIHRLRVEQRFEDA